MNIFGIFKKKEVKNAIQPQASLSPIVSTLKRKERVSYTDLNVNDFIYYYQNVAPLSTAIDRISNAFSGIPIKIKDKEGQFINTHPFLSLLNRPNPNFTGLQFLTSCMSYFLITGNLYLIITRKSSGIPIELYIAPSDLVEVVPGTDGFISEYIYVTPFQSSIQRAVFSKIVNKDGTFSYVSNDGTQEIVHLKDFNSNAYGHYLIGDSKLRSLSSNLEHYEQGLIHNSALLKNGATPSGLFSADLDVPEKSLRAIRNEVKNKFRGSANAGRLLFLDKGFKFSSISQNNRDMDFMELTRYTQECIYNRFDIPLSATQESSSLISSNGDQSNPVFYNNAVLPNAKKIYDFFTQEFLSRYSKNSTYKVSYDPFTIDALQTSLVDVVQKKAALNVMSDNEIRNMIDLPDAESFEADEVYKPAQTGPAYNLKEPEDSLIEDSSDDENDIIEKDDDTQ